MGKTRRNRYITRRRVAEVARAVTALDRRVLWLVYRYPFLDGEGIRVLLSSELGGEPPLPLRSRSAVNRQMARLRRLGVVGGHRPPALVGTSPYYYYLEELGAHLLAAESGLAREEFPWSRQQVLGKLPALRHTVEVNAFFVALVRWGQGQRDGGLREWRSEDFCRHEFTFQGQRYRLMPDGYGVYGDERYDYPFFLEWDRGLGPVRAMEGKVRRYCRFYQSGQYLDWYASFPVVLIVTRTKERWRTLLRRLKRVLEREGAVPDIRVAERGLLEEEGIGGRVWYDPLTGRGEAFPGVKG